MNFSKKLITIGVPCYNEELNVNYLYKELRKITDKNSKYNYEFIIVDNGSTDRTKELIKKLIVKDKRIKGVLLSRNFGPEASGQAALDYATGDAFIIISCDLQDPPELILEFIKKWEEGSNIVFAIYTKSYDNFLINASRKIFYLIYKKITDLNVPVNTTGFSLIDSKIIKALKKMPEKYRFLRGLKAWVGFKTAYVYCEKLKRIRGKSSYNIFKYIKHAERGIFGFSYLLLDLIVYLGFILVGLSFLFILIYLLMFFLFGNPLKGAVTILVSIIFFGGIQLLAISIIGKYIQVIVEETKARPSYIVEEIVNIKNK